MIRTLTLLSLLCSQAFAVEIEPFTSDGCSAFPDGTMEQEKLWLECCKAHDYAYWKGGSYEERVAADEALKACVAETGQEEVAALMLTGVRIGGTPYFPTDFRWGYGWPVGRGYKPLSAAEEEAVRRSEAAAEQETNNKESEISGTMTDATGLRKQKDTKLEDDL